MRDEENGRAMTGPGAEQCKELEAEFAWLAAPQPGISGDGSFLTAFVSLSCRVLPALWVPLAKMVLMASLAPSALLVPVDAQEKLALL